MDEAFRFGLAWRRIRWVIGLTLTIASAATMHAQRRHVVGTPSPPAGRLLKLRVGEVGEEFDLRDDRDLARLRDTSVTLVNLAQPPLPERAKAREPSGSAKLWPGTSRAVLKDLCFGPDGPWLMRDRRGWEELRRLSALALQERDAGKKNDILNLLAEVAAALNNNHRPPIRPAIDIVELPLVHYDYTHNRIATGETPAWNLATNPAIPQTDSSQLNPRPSSFWIPPARISSLDLFAGFGRSHRPPIENGVLTYHGPKTGFGGHAGFEAKYGDLEVKVKFGEIHSEPFAARIFWALGYHVDATDYVSELKLRYERRFFQEFNRRKEVSTRISAFAVLPVYTLRFQPRHDPFEFIHAAVMKDGSHLSGSQLKTALLRDAERPDAAEAPENFRPETERAIDCLITRPANLQIKNPKAKSIGPWAFGGLGHEGRRELRGTGLLAAWIGWSDSRFDNTRLKTVDTPRGPELKHYFADLGGGLGRSTGLIYRQGERPNEFEWTFTQPPRIQGKGRMTIPFRITGYRPIEDTPAFEQMTIDDARWMARQIGQLTENQIVAALIASGFGSAHVRLYTEKLISRRDRMVRDLGLGGELPRLRPTGAGWRFSFQPGIDGPVGAVLPDGRPVFAPSEPFVIEDGRLRPTGSTRHQP
jgi:hypothetical protein